MESPHNANMPFGNDIFILAPYGNLSSMSPDGVLLILSLFTLCVLLRLSVSIPRGSSFSVG